MTRQAARILDPFGSEPVEEVSLNPTPLTVVLCQVRFPGQVSKIRHALAHDSISYRLADSYPIVDEQDDVELRLRAGKPTIEAESGRTVLVLRSEDGEWTATIAADAVSLTTTKYRSRSHFMSRLQSLLKAISDLTNPPAPLRVGMRYSNRLTGAPLANLGEIVTPALSEPLLSLQRVGTEPSQTLAQLLYGYPKSPHHVQLRWGLLPPNSTLDQSMPTIAEASWVLDIDAFSSRLPSNDVQVQLDTVERLAERAYRVFRWGIDISTWKESS